MKGDDSEQGKRLLDKEDEVGTEDVSNEPDVQTVANETEEFKSDSGHSLSKRKSAKKEEKQQVVVPIEYVETQTKNERPLPPPVAVISLSPQMERLRWWTERFGGWYGWAFLLFVWLLMYEEPADYSGLVSDRYTIKGAFSLLSYSYSSRLYSDLGGFSVAYSVAYHQCFLAAGHGLLGPRLLNKGTPTLRVSLLNISCQGSCSCSGWYPSAQ